MPRMKRNFVVKTIDGKGGAVQKALRAAGIEVVSVIEIYKEPIPDDAADADAATAAESAADTAAAAPASDTPADSPPAP